MTLSTKSHEQLVAETMDIMKSKDTIEQQIHVQEAILRSQGDVGMKSSLIDAEGFPRSDVDLYAVRGARAEIIKLGNDYRDVMKRIDGQLALVHAQAAIEPIIPQLKPNSPWAKLNGVAPDSPSWNAGLRRGDLVVSFGVINALTKAPVNELASTVSSWEGIATRVHAIRDGAAVIVMLTPQKWAGRGLLGCNIEAL